MNCRGALNVTTFRGVEARVDPLDPGEAADHQPGADEQDGRQRHLQHMEWTMRWTSSLVRAAGAAPAGVEVVAAERAGPAARRSSSPAPTRSR